MKHLISILLLIFITTTLSASSDDGYIGGQSKKRISKKNKSKARVTKRRTRSKKSLARQYKKYENKRELAVALNLARQQKFQEASQILYTLSRNPKYRAEREQIRYILGLMLFEMNMYQTAGYQFVSVVRDGKSRYVDKSLEKLSISADLLNDRTLLNYSMSKINLERFPKSQRDMLRYRVGEYQYQNKQYDKASHNFSRVPTSSPYYSKAKYLQALAYAQTNQLNDAMGVFRKLKSVRDNNGVVDTNRVAAMMGIARIFYQNRSWDQAAEAYREIPKDSPFWHEALFEMSWSLMRSAKLRSVLSNFHSLHSPYYEEAYIPESLLLRGIVYLYICQYDEMSKTLDLFQSIYKPVSSNLKKYLASRPRSNDYYVEYLKVLEGKNSSIPSIMVNKIAEEGDVKATQFYIDQLVKEQALIENMPTSWRKAGVGVAAERLLDRRIRSARRRIGLQIKRHLITMNRDLDKLIEQHDFARFEMLNAKKESIKKRIGTEKNKHLDDSIDREFYIQNGFEYWPFQGEYWLDELGNYHYLGTKTCE